MKLEFGSIGMIATAVVVFPLFWLMCFWLISELGGWASLAKKFATDREPTGDVFPWTTGKCNFFSNYNNCLTASISGEGIHLRPMLLFRFAHKPLFFPWEAIKFLGWRRELFRSGTALEIETGTGIHPVTLYGRELTESIGRHAPDHLTKPPTS